MYAIEYNTYGCSTYSNIQKQNKIYLFGKKNDICHLHTIHYMHHTPKTNFLNETKSKTKNILHKKHEKQRMQQKHTKQKVQR